MSWLGQQQYKGQRQARLRYILEAIELAKRISHSEDITIKSTLTVEHIMPRKWEKNWPISEFDHMDEYEKEHDTDYQTQKNNRNIAINCMGNLTLLTHSLNASISNGAYSVKMPAVHSHSSVTLNRELGDYNAWTEASILSRGKDLFNVAKTLWAAPLKTHNSTMNTYENTVYDGSIHEEKDLLPRLSNTKNIV